MPRPLPVRHRIVSALLALVVLATSVGLTAERHRCRISGRSTVALVLPGGLGRAHEAPAARPAKPGTPCSSRQSALARRGADGCCDISHVLHKLDAKQHASAPAKLLPAPPLALLPAPVWAGLGGTAPLATGVAVGTAGGLSPPGAPRAGRMLLTLLSTLVV